MSDKMSDKTGLPLFDLQRYRNTDPDTSKKAAEDLIDSGRMGQQRQTVFNLVVANPDSTSAELAEIGNLDRYTPSRRLSELVKLGLIKVSGKRPSRTNGNMMQTYRKIDADEEQSNDN